jgi:glutamate-1-semialdehyde 2,1-aminomutase
VIGGGLNIGAYGGRRDVMQQVAPLGPVYQAGTLSGNPLATAAGLAALSLLDAAAYATLVSSAERIAGDLRTVLDDCGIPAIVTQAHSLVGLHFGADAPTDYETAQRTDTDRYARFFHAALDQGVALAPGAYEVLFPGLAHTGDVLDELGHALSKAAEAAA